MTRQNPACAHNTWIPTPTDPAHPRITIETDPINPHCDRHPTGKHKIAIRTIDMWVNEDSPPRQTRLACITGPDGKTIGHLLPHRLAHLRSRYDAARSDGWPQLLGKVGTYFKAGHGKRSSTKVDSRETRPEGAHAVY
jgi:hypothetical protein